MTLLAGNDTCGKILCMVSNERQYCVDYDMYSRSAIVALSDQPPGVNDLFICLYHLWVPGMPFRKLQELAFSLNHH